MVSARENRNSRCHSSKLTVRRAPARPCPGRPSPARRDRDASWPTTASTRCPGPGCSTSMVASAYERMVRSPTQDRVSRSRISGSSIDAVPLRQLDDAGKLTRITDLLAQRGHPALEGQRAHRHAPAVARLADHQVGVGAGVVEEHLVELRVAGQLDDRADLDARADPAAPADRTGRRAAWSPSRCGPPRSTTAPSAPATSTPSAR